MYRDNLRYDIVQTVCAGKKTNYLIGSFQDLLIARIVYREICVALAHSPFDWEEHGLLYDILINGEDIALFCNPKYMDSLLLADEYPVGTTKEMLAKKFISSGQFDYALPQKWVDEVITKVSEYKLEDKTTLYRKLIGGTVWHYPKSGFGHFGGRPCALTREALYILEDYVEAEK